MVCRGRKKRRTKRIKVWAKSCGRCHYCGCSLTIETMTIDHVTPKSKGGSSQIDNLVASCRRCNQAKGNDLPWWLKGAA